MHSEAAAQDVRVGVVNTSVGVEPELLVFEACSSTVVVIKTVQRTVLLVAEAMVSGEDGSVSSVDNDIDVLVVGSDMLSSGVVVTGVEVM